MMCNPPPYFNDIDMEREHDMNRNEKLEIAKRLRHSTEMEMSRDDLEQLLDAELTKPEADMDAELVQQILELLEDTPSPVQQHASWQRIDKRLSFKRWQSVMIGLARFAAIVVMLVLLTYASYGTAQALNWEFLLRLMKPFTETFMVYTGKTPEPTPVPQTEAVYGDFDMMFSQQEFTTLADCPDQIDGYPTKPVWMPSHFEYLLGSMYSDYQITSITHVFKSDAGSCILDISKFSDSKDATSYHFEQLPADNTTIDVADYQVAFYHNTRNTSLTASWLVENTYYCITGPITKDEIILIINAMMK